MKSTRRNIILRIVLTYLLTGVLWIAASDWVVYLLFKDPETARLISTYKGWGYVVVTAILLAGLLYRELRELNRAHQRLEASERRFRLLYQDAPIAFHSLAQHGTILQVNRMWCQVLGLTEEQAIGRRFADLLAPESRERWLQTFDELVSGTRTGFEMELEMLRSDGSLTLTALSGRAVQEPDGGQVNYYCTFQDVTEQRLLEIEARQKGEEYRQIIDTVPGQIYYLNADRTLLRVNHAGSLALRASPADLAGKSIKALFPQYADLVETDFQQILDTGRSILGKMYHVNDLDGRPIWITIDLIPYPGRDGRPAGVVLFVNEITDHVRREQDLERLVDIASRLRGLTGREEISQVVLDTVMEALHVDGAHLALRTQPEEDLRLIAAAGIWADRARGRKVSNPLSLCSQVVSNGQGQLLQHISPPDSFDGMFDPPDIKSAGAVPLIAEQHVLGAVWIGSSRPIPEDDFRLLYTIADMAAAALQRSIHNDMTQLRLRRVSALHYIDMAITSSFDWHVTLNVLLGQAVTMLGVDSAAILKLNPETLMLESVASVGFSSSEIEKTQLKLGESQAGAAALKREVRYIPNLHEVDDNTITRFARAGEDFISYCAAPLVSKGLVKGVLELFHRSQFTPDAEWMDFLEMLAAQAAIAIDNSELFENLQQSINELHQSYDALILGWSRGLELRDAESQGHTNRLVDYTLRLARRMRVPENQLLNLRRGVLLHDIGKIGIPDSILLKPGPLNEEEWQVMRQHPVFAYDLLSPIPGLAPVLELPYCHHERWDGSGYPRGLKGEEIPLSARLFAVVDIWDALSHQRPYREAWNAEKVVQYLRAAAGITLDPRAVDEFVGILQEDGLINSESRPQDQVMISRKN